MHSKVGALNPLSLQLLNAFRYMVKKRKPAHPGALLDEMYIKPLRLNLQRLSDKLRLARNTLFKIRIGKASVTPAIALVLADAFDTISALRKV